MGMRVVGSDIDERMITGSGQNLKHYGVDKADLRVCDVSKAPACFGPADAIVTDPPYGRAASTVKESVESLYRRAFEAFSDTIKPGGKLAVVLPSRDHIRFGLEHFSLVNDFSVKVHGSLTRHFCVFQA